MLKINTELENLLLKEFNTIDNNIGLGKVIINKDFNESIITNGKSLITYSNIKLEEDKVVSNEERARIVNLSNKLIKQRFYYDIMSELKLNKNNVEYLIKYLNKLNGEVVELKYNKKFNRLVMVNNSIPLIKMIQLSSNNKCNLEGKVTLDSTELLKVLKLMYREMDSQDEMSITLQSNNKPLILEMYTVSACVTCIK